MTTENSPSPIECAGIVVIKDGQVLLIQRGTAPRRGEWSIPGGHIKPGEREEKAALRELFEETRITAAVHSKLGTVCAHLDGKDYHLHNFAARWISGTPQAGDDARKALFTPLNRVPHMNIWPKTVQIIQKAAVLLTP